MQRTGEERLSPQAWKRDCIHCSRCTSRDEEAFPIRVRMFFYLKHAHVNTHNKCSTPQATNQSRCCSCDRCSVYPALLWCTGNRTFSLVRARRRHARFSSRFNTFGTHSATNTSPSEQATLRYDCSMSRKNVTGLARIPEIGMNETREQYFRRSA